MKRKILAMVLAGSMIFSQNVYASELTQSETESTQSEEAQTVQEESTQSEEPQADQAESISDVEVQSEDTENEAAQTKEVQTDTTAVDGESDDETTVDETDIEDTESVYNEDEDFNYDKFDENNIYGLLKSDLEDETALDETEESQIATYASTQEAEQKILYMDNSVCAYEMLDVGEADSFTISSTDENVCDVEIECADGANGASKWITYKPKKAGSTTITIKNSKGQTIYDVQITVKDKLPEDAVPIKDAVLRGQLLKDNDKNGDGYISYDEMKEITKFDVDYHIASRLEDISGLEYAENLEDLSLYRTNVSDLVPIAGLKNLKKLYIYNNEKVTDISALKDLTQLSVLYMDNTEVTDISVLENLTQLIILDISNTKVIDIESLANLANLERLNISKTDIADIKALGKLKNLKWLNMSETKVADISALESATALRYFQAKSTQISDISPLKNAEYMQSVFLDKCSNISKIDSLYDLERLEYLSVTETQVSDDERLEFAKKGLERNSYFKAQYENIPNVGGLISTSDSFSVEATGGNTNIVEITDGYKNRKDILYNEGGNVELTLTLNGSKTKVDITVNAKDAEQETAEDNNQSIKYSETWTIDEYDGYSQVSSAILARNGELWKTYPKAEKVMDNVKKYVARWIYSGTEYVLSDYILDKDDNLYSGTEKVKENIKDVKGHYALTNDNKLINLYNDGNEVTDNVVDWKEELFGYVIILKSDGSVWLRADVEKAAPLNEFEHIADNVAQLTDDGYVTNDGEYVSTYTSRKGGLTTKTVASNIKTYYDTENPYYYGTDGNSYLIDGSNPVNIGNIDIKKWVKCGSTWDTYYFAVIDKYNKLYSINPRDNSVTLLANDIIDFEEVSYNTYSVISKDNVYYDLESDKIEEADEAILQSEGDYQIVAAQRSGATSGMLKKNNIDLLSNVKYFWSTTSDDFALRTDGTVWKVTGVPEKIITLGTGGMVYGDVNGDGTVTAADLLIVMNNLSGRTGLTDDQVLAADVDGDGMVTLADLTKMIQYVSGRISSL